MSDSEEDFGDPAQLSSDTDTDQEQQHFTSADLSETPLFKLWSWANPIDKNQVMALITMCFSQCLLYALWQLGLFKA